MDMNMKRQRFCVNQFEKIIASLYVENAKNVVWHVRECFAIWCTWFLDVYIGELLKKAGMTSQFYFWIFDGGINGFYDVKN